MAKQILAVLVDNHAGVLFRVCGLFSRRGYNIETLAVGETQYPDASRITITVDCDDRMLDQVVQQLGKLICVRTVQVLKSDSTISRELMLVKVRAKPKNRHEIIQIANIFGAKVVDLVRDVMTLELSGEGETTAALLSMLIEFGVVEMVRTGTVSLERGSACIYDGIDVNG